VIRPGDLAGIKLRGQEWPNGRNEPISWTMPAMGSFLKMDWILEKMKTSTVADTTRHRAKVRETKYRLEILIAHLELVVFE
jgi:hypothetical protein